jgi:hypothetical protein
MSPTLYLVRDRATRLTYLTGSRPHRQAGGVEFVGLAVRLLEFDGVDRVDAVDVWPTLRSLPSVDVEYFEVPPTWSVDHDVRCELVKAAREAPERERAA